MKLENILTKKELERIKKIGEVAFVFRTDVYQNEELPTDAKKVLMALVDEDADELIRDIINDKFVDYMDKETKIEKVNQ